MTEKFDPDAFRHSIRDGVKRLAPLGERVNEAIREGVKNLNRAMREAEAKRRLVQMQTGLATIDEAFRSLTGMTRDEWEEYKSEARLALAIAEERRRGLLFVQLHAAKVRGELGLR